MAQDVAGKLTRRTIPIPFARFEPTRYPDEALAIAYDAMRWLASGEYVAVEGFARLVVGFSWHQVPHDLIAACARIPSDEIRHAEIALQAAARLSGKRAEEIPMGIDGRRPAHPVDVRAPLGDLDILVATLPALLETIAVALLSEAKRRATDPMMKAVYASVLADEIHHARVGWYYLAWRAPQWSQAERQRLADAVGNRVAQRAAQISDGRAAPKGSVRAMRALGVMDAATQAQVVKRVMEDEIVPAFDALGLGASHAYRGSPLDVLEPRGA
jgi:1,2-phenylacetyl-CoA epoxidase catalytic subunit